MTLLHRVTLYGLLGILGISLAVPGLIELFRSGSGKTGLVAESLDAVNQLRAFNGMMVGLGLVAGWCLFDLENARMRVMALGVVLLPVIVGRIYAMIADGVPGLMTWTYLCIEVVMASVFLTMPPPE
ncbi:MAG: DUF4345 domain-containing protein [Desulfobacteraceae bacterium]